MTGDTNTFSLTLSGNQRVRTRGPGGRVGDPCARTHDAHDTRVMAWHCTARGGAGRDASTSIEETGEACRRVHRNGEAVATVVMVHMLRVQVNSQEEREAGGGDGLLSRVFTATQNVFETFAQSEGGSISSQLTDQGTPTRSTYLVGDRRTCTQHRTVQKKTRGAHTAYKNERQPRPQNDAKHTETSPANNRIIRI